MVGFPHPPTLKQEGSSGSNSCSSLPPIFPPTPTSANSDAHDFMHYFENRITQEFHDSTLFCPSLQSPNYAAMSEGIYSNYFKQEGFYHQPSCLHPTSLPLDGINSPHFDATPPPLTPQSSFCSSNSPLSHISIRSPESAAMTPDMETTRPISQGSSVSSPQVGDVAHTPILTYSTSSSNCTSPLQHAPTSGSIDIAASLDLVAAGSEAVCGGPPTDYTQGYGVMTPPLYAAYPPVTPPIDAYPHQDMNTYPSSYEFELHHLMSDPSELLTECSINEEKDIKPSVARLSSTQAHTPPAII